MGRGLSIIVSSQVANADQVGLLNLIGSSGTLQFFDTNNVFLGQLALPAAPGFALGGILVFAGFPSSFTVSSLAPVGAQPATFSLIVSGSTMVSGLPVIFAQSVAVLNSSTVMPSGTCGVGAVVISSGVH